MDKQYILGQIDKAIAVLTRAPSVNMQNWQTLSDMHGRYCDTEDSLRAKHECGNTACAAGWIAISPEFAADGGAPDPYAGSSPYIRFRSQMFGGADAIAAWLGVMPDELASISPYNNTSYLHDRVRDIILGDLRDEDDDENEFSRFYNKPWAEVTKGDVLSALNDLKGAVEQL